MKIACIIDHLGPGGAQRQLCTLAVELKRMGHAPFLVTYRENAFFRPCLDEAGIAVATLPGLRSFLRPWALRRLLRTKKPDAVLAFLPAPSLYAELAGLPSRRWRLVVSERSLPYAGGGRFDRLRYFHSLADGITTNSHATRRLLAEAMPRLATRIVTIYNCLDLASFVPALPSSECPTAREPHPFPLPLRAAEGARRAGEGVPGYNARTGSGNSRPLRFVVAASLRELKNTLGLARALAQLRRAAPDVRVSVDWYGDPAFWSRGVPDTRYLHAAQRLIGELGLDHTLRLYPATSQIVREYQSADAVLLPSLAEGLPNAICEGMGCGRPILASRVGDAEHLVHQGINGFLFDPTEPGDIAQAILSFSRLSPLERESMGRESRRLAERLFAPGPIAAAYAALLQGLAPNRWQKHSPGKECEVLHSQPRDGLVVAPVGSDG